MAHPVCVVDIWDKLEQFDERWSPKIIAESNGWHVKLVKAAGSFTWHAHPDTDEIFLVLSGSLAIALRDRPAVRLAPGQIFVVPKSLEHCPDAGDGCELVLLEPDGVPNTGDRPSPRSAVDEWL